MASFYYPSPTLEGDRDIKIIRIARNCPCSMACGCPGLHPQNEQKFEIILEAEDADFSEESTACACGHSWYKHGSLDRLVDAEIERRAKVALRIDEFLDESNQLANFNFTDEEIESLRKQMELPPGEERDASFKRDNSPDSIMSGLSGQERRRRSRSLSSSGLSDVPPPVSKRRRISSPLSDDEGNDDAANIPPATPIHSKGAKKAPPVPVLSGARSNARGAKKRAGGGTTTTTTVNGGPQTNGTASSHVPKIKIEDDNADLESIAESTVSGPEEAAPMSIDLPPKEKIVVEEHRRGYIQYTAVKNDGQERSWIVLTGLKNLFQRQLPKMPREYIARLVMDRNSRGLAMIKHGYKVVAGITYRPFAHRGFIEIVFCAVSSSNQVKGYGGHLMDHFKKHIQDTYDNVEYFLTYADNYAIGYFKKQGFSKDVTLDRVQWAGYIKDYEGATLLQCKLVPVDYTSIRDTVSQQKAWVLERIRARSSSHEVRPGIPAFQEGQPPVVLDYKEIPGLIEAGWTAHPTAQELPANIRPPDYVRMTRALRALQAHQQSWPFRTPVNKAEVPDYYEFIKNPMDLHTMQTKLEGGKYTDIEAFVTDVKAIAQNCLLYNPSDSVYAKAAVKLLRYFENTLLKELLEKE